MIKPGVLKKGDVIAFLAPGGGLAAIASHRLIKGKEFFENRGYEVKVYPSATKTKDWSSDTAQNRAKDLMDAFMDKSVKAIISTIGGNTCHQTLEYLDFKKIKNNPKIFSGYSDMTSLHFALSTQSNMVSFYGPAVLPQFGEFPKPEDYTIEHFFKAVSSTTPIGKVLPSKEWTDDKTGDWVSKKDIDYKRKFVKNKGYEWLKPGKVTAPIQGGNITVMQFSRGTKYYPDFKDKILLLETPEGEDFRKGEPIGMIDAFLTNLRIDGTFSKIKGLVFGRGFGYNSQEIEQLKQIIMDNTKGYDFPILYGADIGHTDPMITVPLGVKTRIDSYRNEFLIMESGVR